MQRSSCNDNQTRVNSGYQALSPSFWMGLGMRLLSFLITVTWLHTSNYFLTYLWQGMQVHPSLSPLGFCNMKYGERAWNRFIHDTSAWQWCGSSCQSHHAIAYPDYSINVYKLVNLLASIALHDVGTELNSSSSIGMHIYAPNQQLICILLLPPGVMLFWTHSEL